MITGNEDISQLHSDAEVEDIEYLQEFTRTGFWANYAAISPNATCTHTGNMSRQEPRVTTSNEPEYKTHEDIPLKPRRILTRPYTKDDIVFLRENCLIKHRDMLSGVPPKLPPLRAVNHRIPLVDDNKTYGYYLPKCADNYRVKLMEKIKRYTDAGWWEARTTSQAAPMMVLPKKQEGIRTVIDYRKRNENTVKDVTPFPDQELIRNDVARCKFRSKIDMSNAYEQIRVEPEDVWKTAFATVFGTYVSHTMTMGDCNAPSTFQRLMTHVFREYIGIFVHAYLDDIFVWSNTIEDHISHLDMVFEQLRKHQLYLEVSKCQLFARSVDCLGFVIDDHGLHCDLDKLLKIRNWPSPRNYNDVQRFLGLVQYIAQFLPDIAFYCDPLSAITKNGAHFEWRPIHEKAFQTIKSMTCKVLVLKPLDQQSGEPIWLICDASVSGVGAMYGQGPTWQQCRPAGLMSKKFTPAQHHYRVFELESLAILEGLLKWEDKLLGKRLHVVTDHKTLEFFKTQRRMSSRQARWMEYLARFDFDIRYVRGIENKVADALSRYFEADTAELIRPPEDFVNADVRLDPELDDLSPERSKEIRERMIEEQYLKNVSKTRIVAIAVDRETPRDVEANTLAQASRPAAQEIVKSDLTVGESTTRGNPPQTTIDSYPGFESRLKAAYAEDILLSKVLAKPLEHPNFSVENGTIYITNNDDEKVLCVPKGIDTATGKTFRGTIIENAHNTLGHLGLRRTNEYIRRWFWWPRIFTEVELFCKSCEACQRSKPSNQKPTGILHTLPVPTRPWQSIAMDFLGPFPEIERNGIYYNLVWVIICRLISMVHIIPLHTKTTAEELSWIFLREFVRLHGIPDDIVCDRDPKFTAAWWQEVQRLLGVKLLMSTSFHPETDGSTERVNRSIGQVVRSAIRADQLDWIDRITMSEFAINSSVSVTTKYAPFFLNGGHIPTIIKKFPPGMSFSPGITYFAYTALSHLANAHDSIIEARVFQRFHANQDRRKGSIEYEQQWFKEGNKVYLSTENISLPKGRTRKLAPKFIGPFVIRKSNFRTSNYELVLSESLVKRRIHPVFHAKLLRPHIESCDELFPNREQFPDYDFGASEAELELFVDAITRHRTTGKRLEFEVRWALGDSTWEPLVHVNKCRALDDYLRLRNVSKPSELLKGNAPSANRRRSSRRT